MVVIWFECFICINKLAPKCFHISFCVLFDSICGWFFSSFHFFTRNLFFIWFFPSFTATVFFPLSFFIIISMPMLMINACCSLLNAFVAFIIISPQCGTLLSMQLLSNEVFKQINAIKLHRISSNDNAPFWLYVLCLCMCMCAALLLMIEFVCHN